MALNPGWVLSQRSGTKIGNNSQKVNSFGIEKYGAPKACLMIPGCRRGYGIIKTPSLPSRRGRET